MPRMVFYFDMLLSLLFSLRSNLGVAAGLQLTAAYTSFDGLGFNPKPTSQPTSLKARDVGGDLCGYWTADQG